MSVLLKWAKPALNPGAFVFCTLQDVSAVDMSEVQMMFKEAEGFTVILPKEAADSRGLAYSFVASWITLTVHSSLQAVGLTAAFSKALAAAEISCNVVAAFYHDHIFVDEAHAETAMDVLSRLSL